MSNYKQITSKGLALLNKCTKERAEQKLQEELEFAESVPPQGEVRPQTGTPGELLIHEEDLPSVEELDIDFSIFDPPNGTASRGALISPEIKIKAVILLTVYGNQYKTARLLQISPQVLHFWTKQHWFPEVQKKVRKALNERLDSKLTATITVATEQILDRVTNGNIIRAKNGVRYRVPLTIEELSSHGLRVPFDKRSHMRGEFLGTEFGDKSKDTIENILVKLAEKFEEVSTKTLKTKGIVIDNERNEISINSKEEILDGTVHD